MSDLDILFPIPDGRRNSDDMGLPISIKKIDHQAASSASDAKYQARIAGLELSNKLISDMHTADTKEILATQARIKELEEALRRIMEDDISLSKCVAIAYKVLSTSTLNKANTKIACPECAKLKRKLAWWEAPHDSALFAEIKQQASHKDSLCASSIYTLHLERRIKGLERIIAESQKQEPVAWFTTYADGRLKELVALSQCTADDLMAYGMFLTPLFTKTIIQGEIK